MKTEKREAKSTVYTKDGTTEVKIIIDLTPEDIIELMCKFSLAELSGMKPYESMENNSVLNRGIKSKLVGK